MIISFIKVTKQDRLLLNYDPEVINTVKTTAHTAINVAHSFTGNYSYFALNIFYPPTTAALNA